MNEGDRSNEHTTLKAKLPNGKAIRGEMGIDHRHFIGRDRVLSVAAIVRTASHSNGPQLMHGLVVWAVGKNVNLKQTHSFEFPPPSRNRLRRSAGDFAATLTLP